MASWTGEEVAEGIELWLKTRRDENRRKGDSIFAEVTDCLLDEARDAFAEGWMPWQPEWSP
jgi:hypothetical protein